MLEDQAWGGTEEVWSGEFQGAVRDEYSPDQVPFLSEAIGRSRCGQVGAVIEANGSGSPAYRAELL